MVCLFRQRVLLTILLTPLLPALLTTSAFASERADAHYTLKLKWYHQFQFAGYYAAKEKGYYRDEGLDIELQELGESDSIVDDVLAGRADFGIGGASLILRRFNGDPVVMLAAIFQSSPLALMTMAQDNLKSPLDLVGKRVMYRLWEDDAQLSAVFNEFGMSHNDFDYMAHNYDNDALLKGQVDAISVYVTNQPYLYTSRGLAVNIISPANYGVDFYGDILFTSEQMIGEHPQAVLAFRRASLKGWEYALENQQEIVDLILSKYPGKQPKGRDALLFEAEATRRLIKPGLVDVGQISPKRFERLAGIYRERGLVEPQATLEGIYYTEYYQREPYREWMLRISIIGVVLVSIVAALMGVFNRRLKRLVELRSAALYQSDAKLQRYLKTINQYTITAQFDKHFNFIEVSDAFCRVSGYDREGLVGRHYDIIGMQYGDQRVYEQMQSVLDIGGHWNGELIVATRLGRMLNVEVNIEPIVNLSGNVEGYASVWFDITDKKRIELLAITDTLTGLFNRIKVNDTLHHEVKRVARGQGSLSIIFFDLDHFKKINDSLGHMAGDRLLVAVAKIVQQRTRDLDVVGRWGGEEFVIVCPQTGLGGALELAEQLRLAIHQAAPVESCSVTASFGVSEWVQGESVEALIDRADQALYLAKGEGRNCVRPVVPHFPFPVISATSSAC
jgi:diguanylate cyclase (GGDEF)-like protein/PAS domain S-box-containing protein